VSRRTMDYRTRVQLAVGAGGIPVPTLIPVVTYTSEQDSQYFAEDGGLYFTLATYHAEGVVVLREDATSAQHEALGRVAASIHNAIAKHILQAGADAFPYVHRWMNRGEVVEQYLQKWLNIADCPPSGQMLTWEAVVNSAQMCSAELSRLAPHLRDIAATHNDLGFSNCHFSSPSSDEVVMVFDFDIAQGGQRVGEFNNLLWARPGHLPSLYSRRNIESVIAGYASTIDGGLSGEERRGIIEVARSRLIEAVIRHELRLFDPFVLSDPQFNAMRENRYETLALFNADFPQEAPPVNTPTTS
jgi:Ser/Thr protein kinase RdoA (MazF antagonist)